MKQTKASKKNDEKRIERAYRATCANIAINVMDIGKVFARGHELIASGADDATLAVEIRAFVETIRCDVARAS